MAPRFDDEVPDAPEPTVQPSDRTYRERMAEADEKVVPLENVGGAAPTPLGLDSGGNVEGSDDELANLSEPEPPEAPELEAVHVRDSEKGGSRRRR
jgi:hypothetical protein